MLQIVFAVGALALLQASQAAPDPAASDARAALEERLRAGLEELRERHGVPALGGAIVTADGLAALAVVGVRSAGGEAQVEPGDRWHIGSCTKAMTATLAARLVERELVSWDDTLEGVFPDLAEGMDPAWRGGTLRWLLSNRGGAPANLDADGLWGRLWQHDGTPREQRRTLVEEVLLRPPELEPGTKFLYSNAGFAIAGAMLETRLDKPWEELMRQELFEPLGMTSAGFGAPGTPGKLDQPLGHRTTPQGQQPVPLGKGDDNPAAIGPAGTVHASLEDWGRFAAAHLPGAAGQGEFLKAESWTTLHTPPEGQDYAMGWGIAQRPWAGGTALTHSGSNTMWFCTVWLAPQKGFGVLVTTNCAGPAAPTACDEACSELIRLWNAGGALPR
jgi:CubicO group peptidase (beta-lactamase class C family)